MLEEFLLGKKVFLSSKTGKELGEGKIIEVDSLNEKVVAEFKTEKKTIPFDAFNRQWKFVERSNLEKFRELCTEFKKSKNITSFLKTRKHIDGKSNFKYALKNHTIKRGCIISGYSNTEDLYADLCDAFNFERGAYTNPQGQSCFARYANETHSVWFLVHNSWYDEYENVPNPNPWTNIINDNLINEIWHFEKLDNAQKRQRHYQMYSDEYVEREKPRIVFAKINDNTFIFLGVYKYIQQKQMSLEDFETDNGETLFELYSEEYSV